MNHSKYLCFKQVCCFVLSVNADLTRSNNAIEGWQRLTFAASAIPSFHNMEALKREQDLQNTDIRKLRAGCQNMNSTKKYRDQNEKLKSNNVIF